MKEQALKMIEDIQIAIAREKASAENDYNVRIVCKYLERQLVELKRLVSAIASIDD